MKWLKALLAVFFALPALAVDPIPSNRLPYQGSWSNLAGVSGGIPNVTTIYTTHVASATTAMIQHSLDTCPSNQVVFCSNGVYTITAQLGMAKDGIVLRGGTNANGTPATKFNTATFISVRMCNSGDTFDTSDTAIWNTVNISSGFTRGSTHIVLASTPSGGLATNQLIWLHSSVGGAVDGGSFALFLGTDPYVVVRKITGFSGSTIDIDIPINPDFTMGTMRASTCDHTTFRRMGLENIQFGGSELRYVGAQGTYECWVKNCIISNSPSGSVRQIYINTGARFEVRHCDLGTIDAAGSDAYSIFSQDATGVRVEDCYFHNAPNFYPQLGSELGVFAYNYAVDVPYGSVPGWLSQIIYNHGCMNSYNLYEGNVLPTHYDDGLSNNPNDPTATRCSVHLRERLVGWDTSDGGKIYNAHGITILPPGATNNVITGCVIGKTNFHTVYDDPGGSSETKPIYTLDGVTNITVIIRSNNWNAVSVGIPTIEAMTAGQVTANSYLYASKPSYFGTLTWPPNDPTNWWYSYSASGTNIPAGYRVANSGNEPPAGGDTNAPTITITGPTSATTYNTTVATVDMSGTASDDVALSSVTYSLSGATSGGGSASGTTSWSFTTPTLNAGTTTVTMTATDTSNNTANDTLDITYTPPVVFLPIGRLGRVGP